MRRPTLYVPNLAACLLSVVGQAGCAGHTDFVNLRQEVRESMRAQKEAQDRSRERDQVWEERLRALEVTQESGDLGRRVNGLVLRLEIMEERLKHLEETSQRQAALPRRSTAPADFPEGLGGVAGVAPSPGVPLEPPSEPQVLDLPGLTPTSAFNLAYNDYLTGRYDLAVTAFQRFLQDFPSSPLAPKAHYWLGESYYQKRDHVRAIQSYERVVKDSPDHEKVPSALFKIGLAAMEIGDVTRARNVFKRVIENFSASKEAKLAKSKLAELR